MNPLDLRIGIGHDTHRFVDGNGVRLGGVDIPYTRSLHGHSDADALLHAITDALLGAASLGDIGELFPDTDAVNRNRDSAEMLTIVTDSVRCQGWEIVNVDCIVFAQAPKLSPYKQDIKKRIASILKIDANQVGIKAKTGENVGHIGRGEAIACEAAVLVYRRG
ncbi:MAG: 2-C-methyl-D-erythritol 2,4-cyclodiphosphate synthase [Planctomycetaceae bacterium]|jgi:2-C-methyl-D-erythritol 2,4-cyclodiphosphate synthase|nr:2-C-methyl-D-erythritol 2,4-cyclodiphosphate synthase [Planctomycetaceae bacterium]